MDLSPDEEHFQGRLLHQAALWDNLELVRELLASGADARSRDARGRSALHAAALAERSRCLAALCAAGADLDAVSDLATGGKTALHIAAERGHVENIRALLKAGAALELRDAAGDCALALAERRAHRHAAVALRDAADALERERLSQHAALRELVSRGDAAALRQKLAALGAAAGLLVNMTPGAANTLLYLASESGHAQAVAALLAAGADGRAQPATRYGPLFAAARHGHANIARTLLQHFPEAAQQETVEKWLPLHAAVLGGHAPVVTLLLEYPYPESVLNTYSDASGSWQYLAAFDVNARDARGQSALHVACSLGRLPCVAALLRHAVPASSADGQAEPLPPRGEPSPLRSGISLGIHAIVSKLTGASRPNTSTPVRKIRPVRVDLLLNTPPPLTPPQHATNTSSSSEAKERRRSRSASAATRAESAPGRPCVSPSPSRADYTSDREGEGGWSALALACRAGHAPAAELLLAHGATDAACRALREAVRRDLPDLAARILATKAFPDPDYKLNKASVCESVFSRRPQDSALSYSALCPTTACMLQWRELRCPLPALRMSWLRQAALAVNSRLGSERAALAAITRVDVSNNELRCLPTEIFSLPSLRCLNAAGNKLSRLPDPAAAGSSAGGPRRARGRPPPVYTAPQLHELYLQDNRLEWLPGELFLLPALATLDVSNNKLRALPAHVWAAPALADLNAAFNLLRDLPTGAEEKSSSRSPSIDTSEDSADAEPMPVLGNRTGNAICSEARRAHPWRAPLAPAGAPVPRGPPAGPRAALLALNLAHNQFTCVPAALACRAHALQRLNMSYNSLRTMSYVTSYPASLRQLDLSHNEITCWPSLPQIENFGPGSPLACYCPARAAARPPAGGGVRSQLLSAACPARAHLRLEATRTLILSNNLLTRIQLTTDDDGSAADAPHDAAADDDDSEDWGNSNSLKGRLLFPLLSMLDVSCNLLRSVPPGIHLLSNLSVLNISGNKDISTLPPQMGLLSRLWSISAGGCGLQDPLRTMLAGDRYKSAQILSYLRGVLHCAVPYARMRLMLVGRQGIGKTTLLECLRQESSIQHRRKATDHWAARMGNKSSRRNLSTVGVDIGTWTYEKQRSTRGPVTFRTWDFGGQREYYATHQYFLSRRSLYLVVWKVTDGREGLLTALDWLRSIQARAPGSPVIMVGTHYDQAGGSTLPDSESPEALQRLIRSRVMGAPHLDKLGIPVVMDSLEVSCSTRHNIRLLADIIYSVAFSVKPPGSKEPVLEQLVPAAWLALEDCVTSLAADLPEPVLQHREYKRLVNQYMQQKNLKGFRDAAELHQATMFLHDNGVLLHYDDAALKELYFVRPQWLCDVLAHVVTVREVNPFAASGIMKVEDLAHVFKASPALARAEEACPLGLSLLHKFELALSWDARTLLVPPLLPEEEPAAPQLPLRSRAWAGGPRCAWPPRGPPAAGAPGPDTRGTDSPALVHEPPPPGVRVSGRAGAPLTRLLLLTYVPCGFWARLHARLLPDAPLQRASARLYAPGELESDGSLGRALDMAWGWAVWRRGLALRCGPLTALRVRELPAARDPLLPAACPASAASAAPRHPYEDVTLRVEQDGAWCEFDVQSSACIEIQLPADVCVLRRDDAHPIAGYQSISLEPSPSALARLLAIVSDHVDLLLEDWYPALGTRFVHTSEGRCLITRVVPCPGCLQDAAARGGAREPDQLAQMYEGLELEEGGVGRRPRLSQESRASDADSGVGAESNASSRMGSVEGAPRPAGPAAPAADGLRGWTVEACILAACAAAPLRCGLHPDVTLQRVAPDTLFLDVPSEMRARWEHITRRGVAGRGAFGTVLSAVWKVPGEKEEEVALKALQPVPPPAGAPPDALQAYKAGQSRWERAPAAGACRAYCALRQELSILVRLRHPHCVPLRAVCPAPLALLLPLAPKGGLDGVVRAYAGCGARVRPRAARAALLQAARALEYLHARRILYRDLKSENVLVWRMPAVEEAAAAELDPAPIDVHVKLGDYGISRLAPPSGAKGFGGTEGFMAPEIMRYNGEEEYNEKVDCFSFGMLVYELVSGRQPFEGHEAVKEAVLEGARPALSARELESPACLLETMRRCWASAPALRPSAGALVSALAAPECAALSDAAAARRAAGPAALRLRLPELETTGWEIWFGGEAERAHSLLAPGAHFSHHHALPVPPDNDEPVTVTALCTVDQYLWVGDSAGRLSVYDVSTCALAWMVRLQDAVGGPASAPAGLQALRGRGRVAVALRNGRLFLVCSSRPEEEGTFVLTELGTATELCCLAAHAGDDKVFLWAGGAGLTAYCVSQGGVSGVEELAPASARVAALAAADDAPYVFAYIEPGVCVYQWSCDGRQTGKLDCSKLEPCCESLQEVDGAPEDQCKVTSLCCARGVLLVGTARGSILLAASDTLRPRALCRPYQADVSGIVALLGPPGSRGEDLVATFGSGYRPLLQRYAPVQSNNSNTTDFTGYHCLLWKLHLWIHD